VSVNRTRARRWGAGKASAVRHLYNALEPVTQVELARRAGVSQPAVSQYLSSLRAHGDAVFVNPGWLPQRDQLPATYASKYSSRFTDQEAWYRIDAVSAQVHDLNERDPRLVWSGDIAADWVRPWKIPTTAIAYGSIPAEWMDECGFVRADTAATASMLVRPFPDDRFADEAEQLDGLRVAPRLHFVADLIGLGGDDRIEAASRFAERESSPS
jgi:hypothetical protein